MVRHGEEDTHDEVTRRPQSGRLLAAVIIGNALEWYDFIIYGFLAALLAKHFFATTDPTTALLSSYAAFALPFIVRPIGGVLIGLYSDRAGRGAALTLIMGAMSVAMLIMTFTPTYASIGIAATILLTVARLLQALSAGGEFGSAAAFLIEAAPARRRFLFSGLYSAGTALATILAALLGLLITEGISPAQQDAWGWRLPFAVGLLIAPIGYYVRSQLKSQTIAHQPLVSTRVGGAIASNLPRMVVATLIAGVANAGSYVFNVFAPTYVVNILKLPAYVPFLGLLASGLASLVFVPLMGAVADRIGKERGFTIGLLALMLLILPLYMWLNSAPSLPRLLACATAFSLISAIYSAVYPALMAELFPSEIRATCMALSYNVSAMVFGAFSLFFITLVMARTGNPFVPAFYVSGMAALCLIVAGLYFATKRSGARKQEWRL